ncbi:MAG: hypothetical protein ABII01_05980 [Candidatus Woesearchaeota archaeon]
MRNLKMKKKAQMFSMDLIIAMISFLIIILIGIWTWDYTLEKSYLTELRGDLEIISKNSLNVLVQTPGDPSNWNGLSDEEFNRSNIISLGLAKSSSKSGIDIQEKGKSAGMMTSNYLDLDTSKIERLSELNATKYDDFKRMIGILGPEYEFEIRVMVWNGTGYSTRHQIGARPADASQNIVRSDRFALYNGTWANVLFYIWQECIGVRC